MARRRKPPAPPTPPSGGPSFRMRIEPDYRGHRIGVDAQFVADGWHVEIRIRRVSSEANRVVLRYELPASLPDPERRGMVLGKTWVKRHGPRA